MDVQRKDIWKDNEQEERMAEINLKQEMNSLFVYDSDRNRPDVKPEFSIPQLITQAILSKTDRKMTLHDICIYISKNYPFYKLVIQALLERARAERIKYLQKL